ncbi:MAG: ATP synthase F1 subunit epsilon [Anaerolineaceae bacterium]|nr:ATP synthase F1 subunit epsilon [Anaerolineaceae bacterium]
MSLRCEIVSQDRVVYSGDADMVVIPGYEGVMGILPNHSQVLTLMRFGIITVKTKLGEQYFTVAGGVAEVQPDQVTVLADAAENVLEIDVSRAESAKRIAEELIKLGPPPDTDTYLKIESSLRKSNLRLEAVRRYRGQRSRLPGINEEDQK